MNEDKLVTMDIECYENYLLVMFRKISRGDVVYFEKFNNSPLDKINILKIINKYTIVSFNGIKYDIVVLEAALAGFSNVNLKKITNMLIQENKQPWEVRKKIGIAALKIDHIDLIQVAPLKASLKIYGGRMHTSTMQDLPIEHDSIITDEQRKELVDYCINDNKLTAELFHMLEKEIKLRCDMTDQYGVDVRSKSDAQIAEQVIKVEMSNKYNIEPSRNRIESGKVYYYNPPPNINFKTEQLQEILKQYSTNPYILQHNGHLKFNFDITEEDRLKSGKNKGNLPKEKTKMKFTIGDTKYTIGLGGIHSNEKSKSHVKKGSIIIRDYDVASYYPNIILNNKLYPDHLGNKFLKVYKSIVDRRLKAKKEGNKVVNESLKITINGSFGKFADKWSCLYSPNLMMQVTVTGQLSLLMLIERLELAGISVISANTDGIVLKFDKSQEYIVEQITEDWQFETNYELESTDYLGLYSRDVNNYIAIKENNSKGKGAYSDRQDHFYILRSNPANEICIEAVKEFLSNGTSVEKTITDCKDIRKFVTVRTVTGGAVYDFQLLGKAIRWYYSTEPDDDAIYYNTSFNKVPRSDGAKPLMVLPDNIPKDINYKWYIEEANNILENIGYKN